MTTRRTLIILITFLLALSSLAQADVKQELEKAWAEMDAGFSQLDAMESIKYMAPDYKMTFAQRPGFEIARPLLIQVLNQQFPKMKQAGGKLTSTTEVTSVEEVKAGTYKVKTTTNGTERESAGAPLKTTTEFREEMWTKEGGKWQLKSSHILETKKG